MLDLNQTKGILKIKLQTIFLFESSVSPKYSNFNFFLGIFLVIQTATTPSFLYFRMQKKKEEKKKKLKQKPTFFRNFQDQGYYSFLSEIHFLYPKTNQDWSDGGKQATLFWGRGRLLGLD